METWHNYRCVTVPRYMYSTLTQLQYSGVTLSWRWFVLEQKYWFQTRFLSHYLWAASHTSREAARGMRRDLLHSAHSIFLDLWVFFHRVHAVSYTWLVTKIFFQFTYVDSSSMSRASVLPDKRAACVVNKKDFVCAKRRICRPRKPLVPVFVLMRLKIGQVKT